MSSVVISDDPRDPSSETKLTLPESWQRESPDAFSSSVMFISGLIMVTRNRYLAWPALVMSINTVINQHPLRTKEGGQSPASTVMMGISALIASYVPLMLISPSKPVMQTPLTP